MSVSTQAAPRHLCAKNPEQLPKNARLGIACFVVRRPQPSLPFLLPCPRAYPERKRRGLTYRIRGIGQKPKYDPETDSRYIDLLEPSTYRAGGDPQGRVQREKPEALPSN